MTEPESWDSYVESAVTEVRQLGADSPQVTRRLLDLIDDIRSLAPHGRREVLERQRQLVIDATSAQQDDHDVRLAATPDRQGLTM